VVVAAVVMTDGYTLGGQEKSENLKKKDEGGEMHRVRKRKGGEEKGGLRNGERTEGRNKRMKGEKERKKKGKAARGTSPVVLSDHHWYRGTVLCQAHTRHPCGVHFHFGLAYAWRPFAVSVDSELGLEICL
jgi:hypothetical protein